MKKLLAAFAAAALCLCMAACGGNTAPAASAEPTAAPEAAPETEPEAADTAASSGTLRIAGLKGPTTMGMVNLMAGNTAFAGNIAVDGEASDGLEFSMYGSADEVVPLLVQGELDAAAVPANLAAVLCQKTGGEVEVAAINTLGVLYVVEQGDTVQSFADLKGKTVLSTGKGTTPEYVLRYLLAANGLDPDTDVDIQYFSEATEVLAQLAAGTSTVAVLPQPFVTAAMAQVDGLRTALDFTAEWEKAAGTNLVTGVLVVRKASVAENQPLFDDFMAAYAESVSLANSDTETTAALCEQYGIVAKAAIAQKALPGCNIVFETGAEMKTDLQAYYQVLYDADPASVGGALPDDTFYYGAE